MEEHLHGGFRRGKMLALETTEDDLQEEEVWGSNSKLKTRNYNDSSGSSSSSSSAWRRFAASPRTIPRSANSSAPVDIPDWNKILKKKTNKNLWDDDACNDDDEGLIRNYKFDDVEKDDGDGDGDDEMVPPHEYLARRLASTQIASFSMCEGVGRTLKGRDLSKLRNAILTKTGFLE
ncbi:hypothetical protein BUALT_Bualt03G0077100 [Buddleja alternifolia]|uniref:Senescence regulator n=1 Tax=Buddleja alternifolia TaxID=168488 RepID=A0AAV6XW77_9LAMI|nr:hypothetical protein BUALT_Bualt03G0077100 [Buddleja alternifolia]